MSKLPLLALLWPALAGAASPQPAPLMDHHQHLLTPAMAVQGQKPIDSRAMIAMLDAAGIRRAVVLSNAFRYGDPRNPLSDEYSRVLAENGAQCLAVDPSRPDTVFAGLREGGVRRSVDAGETWIDCGLPEPGVFSLAVGAADGTVYVGTEPSRLFASRDGGDTWEALDALLELPSRPTWRFPPRC